MTVEYPIAIDSNYAVWQAFDNHYWPAFYFVDAEGRIRHHRFGEGDYQQSEAVLQRLLAESGADATDQLLLICPGGVEAPADWENLASPETYLGYARAERFASPGFAARDERRRYTAPDALKLNQWALTGAWTVGREAAVSNEANGRISCHFHARDLNLVMGPGGRGASVPFRVLLDGQPPGAAHGVDVDVDGTGVIGEPRVYQLIRQPGALTEHTFDISFLDPQVEAYVFTFG
jgi:hypothetical protein